uniref:Protein AAR2 homolog n=1 Tax=Steinernema glaseri TaxID=37863 RepID=A0A1I7ZK26_9BILA
MSERDALMAADAEQVPPELATKLFEEGGFLIVHGLPPTAEFGIDYKLFKIGPKFMGVKMVPFGTHFVYLRPDPQAPFISFFWNCTPQQIVIRRWNKVTETLNDPESVDTDQGDRRLVYSVRSYDSNLGPYDFESFRNWKCLSTYISQKTIARLNPQNPGAYIYAHPEASTMEEEVDKNRPEGTQSYQVVDRQHPTRLRFADEEGLPKLVEREGCKIRFTEVPSMTFEETMKKRSGTDGSERLIQFMKNCGGDREFLGEFQAAFIAFLMGTVHDAFVQWKKIIHLVCSCRAAMKIHPKFFSAFLATLHYQLKTHNDDYFQDELSKSNFLLYTLANLFANISDVEETPETSELRSRGRKFKILLEKKFSVSFDLEEEAPTVA